MLLNLIKIDNVKFNSIYIYSQDAEQSQIYKKTYIYLNSTDVWNFVIKRFNFSIFESMRTYPGHEYFELCQGEKPKTEKYFYKSSHYIYELFTPVFGNINSFFIEESEIRTLSDFDFSKITETNSFLSKNKTGFLKIACKEPTMIKHSYLTYIEDYSYISPGEKYIYSTSNSHRIKFTINDIYLYKGKIVLLKFTLLGVKNNYQIEILVNKIEYILGNKSLELELQFPDLDPLDHFIRINAGKDIKEELLIELVVEMKDEYKYYYTIQNFNESLGNFNISGRSFIIKVPKEFDEKYYNYSIMLNSISYSDRCHIEISYDKIEFITKNYNQKDIYEYNNIIPLFKVNPYSYIPNNSEKSDEKFFYILIYNPYCIQEYIYIKKPKLFTDIKPKQINTFPQLKGEDEKYYYQIPLLNEDYDSLLIQTYNDRKLLSFTLSEDNEVYPIFSDNYLHILPIDKKDILNKNVFLNYYGASFYDGNINFISKNEYVKHTIDKNFLSNFEVSQKEGKNKLIISFESYSYYIKRPTIYYILINESDDDIVIFSALSGKRNFGEKKMMFKFEDNGENNKFETEVDIDKEIYNSESWNSNNYMTIIPVDKESNLILIDLKAKKNFYYYYEKKTKNYLFIIVIIAITIILLFIFIIIGCRKKKKNNNIIEDKINMNERILSDD